MMKRFEDLRRGRRGTRNGLAQDVMGAALFCSRGKADLERSTRASTYESGNKQDGNPDGNSFSSWAGKESRTCKVFCPCRKAAAAAGIQSPKHCSISTRMIPERISAALWLFCSNSNLHAMASERFCSRQALSSRRHCSPGGRAPLCDGGPVRASERNDRTRTRGLH